MRADQKMQQLRVEEQIAVQWHGAQMYALARGGKLTPLDEWLARVRPQKKRSIREMILALQDAAARGAPIMITKVKG